LSLARSANLVRQPANPIAHTVKMPDNGRVRRPNPLLFEKSRLGWPGRSYDLQANYRVFSSYYSGIRG
jgi:hypothetical protein